MTACDDCARTSWLISRLAGHLERRRAERAAIRGVLALPDEHLIEALGGERRAAIKAEWAALDARAVRTGWVNGGSLAICRCDEDYPPGLHELPDPPAVLHVSGDAERALALLGARAECDGRVAIIGARRASPDAAGVARELGRGCGAAGLCVVSGMALGVDGAAHEGALDAGADTIAVLACGTERAYPPSRRRLHAQIIERGLVVSELTPGTAPWRWAFPARNRIIAALCGLTVIVEAAERSGSLITAEIALELGRAVGAVPGPVSSWRSRGSNALLRDGANVIRDVRDLLDDLCGVGQAAGAPARDDYKGLAPHLRDVLEAVAGGADTPAASASSPIEVPRVLQALAELELLGLVERRPGGRYSARAGGLPAKR